jgi:flagellar basal-body rod protein FlgF
MLVLKEEKPSILYCKGSGMIQGIYLASQAMSPLLDKQDQIAHNLANIQTTGYKQSGLFMKTFQKFLANDENKPFAQNEIKPDEAYIDYREGAMIKTDGALDVFIKGSGFLTVMTPNGVRYTRNGHMSLDAEGMMVTSDGSRVMSNNGFIHIDDREGPVSISTEGCVIQNNETKAVLRISDFKKPYRLTREGNGYLKPESPDTPVVSSQGYATIQGFLEGSNVDTIANMVTMISSYRNFEADQKALQAQDETLEKAVNQIGRLS